MVLVHLEGGWKTIMLCLFDVTAIQVFECGGRETTQTPPSPASTVCDYLYRAVERAVGSLAVACVVPIAASQLVWTIRCLVSQCRRKDGWPVTIGRRSPFRRGKEGATYDELQCDKVAIKLYLEEYRAQHVQRFPLAIHKSGEGRC